MIRASQLHYALVSSLLCVSVCISFLGYLCICLQCVIFNYKRLAIVQLQLSFDSAKPQKERDDRPAAVKAFKRCCSRRCLDSPFP